VAAVTAKTRTEEVYGRLRADILAGRRQPGERLPFAELTEWYGASMGVTREVLSRLVEQGLVVSEPQVGFRVVPLSVADLLDLTEARGHIEVLAVRLAIEHGNLAWESRLVAAHHALDRTPMMSGDDPALLNPVWTSAHAEFHVALCAGCPNARIKATAANLRDAAELYRHWSVPSRPDDPRDIQGEHRAMLEAAIARDGDRTAALLLAHLRDTAAILVDAFHASSDGTTASG